MTRIGAFDLAGEPLLASDLRAAFRDSRYDGARGLEVERRRFGVDREPLPRGPAIERYGWSSAGCLVSETYHDVAGQPTTRRGVHAWRYEPDARCESTLTWCEDVSEKRVACGPDQPSGTSYRRDQLGQVTSKRHHGPAGEPALDGTYDVFEIRYTYDDAGRTARESCFDDTGAAVECSQTGFHARLAEYDDAGRQVALTFQDAAGQPTSNMGTFRRVNVYDAYDHLYEAQNLGADGKPEQGHGVSSTRRLYDTGHRLFGVLLYDRDGKPARYRACYTGKECPRAPWHAVAVIRGRDGRATENAFFDADKGQILRLDCEKAPCWR